MRLINCVRMWGLVLVAVAMGVGKAEGQSTWERPGLVEGNRVEMGGVWGNAYARGLGRLGREPFTVQLVLADVNFGMKRWFTNFSGDISGRFLEVASWTSAKEKPEPAILREVMEKITQYQKGDGHFGVEVDWNQPIDLRKPAEEATMMPILWGNGRLLLGLVAAYDRFGDPRMLDSAKKLGDFYEKVVIGRFCDPKRVEEYRTKGSYAGAYVTCTFEGMEGLVRLYRATKDKRYLETAKRMADFHEAFDTLPVDHSHGSLSQHEALVMLYQETGEAKYLNRVIARWERAVKEGFINPTGGVLEKFWVTGYGRDEGCSEADWLRLNLMLWRETGQTRYLDMAERLMWTEYLANQWPSGGFGHRNFGLDGTGPYAFDKPSEESLWCCSFHCPLGLYELKSYLAVGDAKGIWLNFPMDFIAPVNVGQREWVVSSKMLPAQVGVPVRCDVEVDGEAGQSVSLRVRVPEWANEVVVKQGGRTVETAREGGYLKVTITPETRMEIEYHGRAYLEDRRMKRVELPKTLPGVLENVVVRNGPCVLVARNGGSIQSIAMRVNGEGKLVLKEDGALLPWYRVEKPGEPHAFVFNVRVERE